MSPLTLLAIDAGQTGTKVRLHWADGSIRDDTLPGILTDRPLAPQLADAAERVAHTAGETPAILAIGASGATDVRADADVLLHRPALAGVHRVVVAHDSVTSFLGALGDQQGAVVAAGTGVVTLGVGPRTAVRVDGWGNIMGDAGSGYWIGREALDAVMRAYDGRGETTALTPLVRDRWPDLESAYISLQAAPDRVRVVASLAAPTAALAADGDQVARRICERAAAELALSVTSALRTTSAAADSAAAAIGGVLRSDLIRVAFETAVRAARPEARLTAPIGTGIDGAAILAALEAEHPLRERIAEVIRAGKEEVTA